ncbi:MAG: thioredoxin domain-containing protein [Patescibacteria group bacterium]|nr:thioredoxin domain-containing protein [Patescibacteria group bacterium]MDE2172510.1 thioredoxin domain-containing protein [Patescibacteria group bacterium]
MDTQQRNSLVSIPGAIIVAGAIVAMAIIWTHTSTARPSVEPASYQTPTQNGGVNMKAVDETDHIMGNPNAPIKIVEYSDPSCPYCKAFNPIMEQVMNMYGPGGQVAWVYRSFPLDKPDANGNVLHPNAGHEAQALECAASLGGNTVFWAFEKHLYETTPSVTAQTPNGLDQNLLPGLAKDVGLDPVQFNDCLSSGQFKDKVEAEYTDGVNAGVNGTPYSIIITPAGSRIPLPGVQTFVTLKNAIDTLLSEATSSSSQNSSI